METNNEDMEDMTLLIDSRGSSVDEEEENGNDEGWSTVTLKTVKRITITHCTHLKRRNKPSDGE